jgi:hypothetical protein
VQEVNAPEKFAGTSERIIAISGLPLFFSPAVIPEALNPFGEVTDPPVITLNPLLINLSSITCFYMNCNPAARPEDTDHFGLARRAFVYQFVKNRVYRFFMKGIVIPECIKIQLQRFTFNTGFVRNVTNCNRAEIRLF